MEQEYEILQGISSKSFAYRFKKDLFKATQHA